MAQYSRQQSTVKVAVYDNSAIRGAQFFGILLSLIVVVLLIIGIT